MTLFGVSQRVRNEACVLGIKDPQLRTNYYLMRAQRRSSHTFPTCHGNPHWYKAVSWWACLGDAVFGDIVSHEQHYGGTVVGVEAWKPRSTWDEGFLMMKQPSRRLNLSFRQTMRQFTMKPGSFLMHLGLHFTANSSQMTSLHKTLQLSWSCYFQIKNISSNHSRPALPLSLFGLCYLGSVSIKADYLISL